MTAKVVKIVALSILLLFSLQSVGLFACSPPSVADLIVTVRSPLFGFDSFIYDVYCTIRNISVNYALISTSVYADHLRIRYELPFHDSEYKVRIWVLQIWNGSKIFPLHSYEDPIIYPLVGSSINHTLEDLKLQFPHLTFNITDYFETFPFAVREGGAEPGQVDKYWWFTYYDWSLQLELIYKFYDMPHDYYPYHPVDGGPIFPLDQMIVPIVVTLAITVLVYTFDKIHKHQKNKGGFCKVFLPV